MCVCFKQADPWGCGLASHATRAYKVRRIADQLLAAHVCVTTGDTALTAAVTSAARCMWTCALACVQETAATPSVLSFSAWRRGVTHFLPPRKLKHQRHTTSASLNATVMGIACSFMSPDLNITWMFLCCLSGT